MLGENISYYRKLRELTQKELANKIGITASAMSRIESGKNTPTASNLQRIASALGVSVEKLKREKTKEPIVELINGLINATKDDMIEWAYPSGYNDPIYPAYLLDDDHSIYLSDFPKDPDVYVFIGNETGNDLILCYGASEITCSSYEKYKDHLKELHNAIKIAVDDKNFIYDHLRALEELEKEEE